MSIIFDFVREGSIVNSDFYPAEKSVQLIKEFITRRDASIETQGPESTLFFNMKLLEEEFRKSYHMIESPYLVSNFILKIFTCFKNIKEFSMINIKGIFFGLKLYFADLEADADVFAFYREKIMKTVRLIDLEIILLITDFFTLYTPQNASIFTEIINKKMKEINQGSSKKKKLKNLLQSISKFQLHDQVDTNYLIEESVNSEMFDEAFFFAKPFKNLSVRLLSLFLPSKNSKHMKNLIKAHSLDIDAFPQLFEFLRYGYFRYSVKEFGYEVVEEKARQNEKDLTVFIRYLLHSKLQDEAFSVYRRYKNVKNLKEYQKKFIKETDFTYLENELVKNDDFRPTSELKNKDNCGKYMHISELGYDEESIVIVKKNNFDEARDFINNSSIIGIDSEFFTNDCSGYCNQSLSIIQIATTTKVFIFDCYDLGGSFKVIYFLHQLLKNEKIMKLGHTFESDLKAFSEFFNNEKPFEINNLVCIETLESKTQKIGLATLCEKYLHKKMCKLEQQSTWNNNPLRRAQIHYAALDAAVLLRLYQLMMQKDKILFTPILTNGSKEEVLKVDDENITK